MSDLSYSFISEPFVTVTQLMQRWNISRNKVLKMLRTRQIQGYRLTDRSPWRALLDSVVQFEKSNF